MLCGLQKFARMDRESQQTVKIIISNKNTLALNVSISFISLSAKMTITNMIHLFSRVTHGN